MNIPFNDCSHDWVNRDDTTSLVSVMLLDSRYPLNFYDTHLDPNSRVDNPTRIRRIIEETGNIENLCISKFLSSGDRTEDAESFREVNPDLMIVHRSTFRVPVSENDEKVPNLESAENPLLANADEPLKDFLTRTNSNCPRVLIYSRKDNTDGKFVKVIAGHLPKYEERFDTIRFHPGDAFANPEEKQRLVNKLKSMVRNIRDDKLSGTDICD